MGLHAFPKIFAVGTDYIADLFKEPVEITEKVDGSQFVFGKFDGDLRHRSKGKEIFRGAGGSFSGAVEVVTELFGRGLLPEGYAFYCEYLRKPKHNVLGYDYIPKNHLALFGMTINGSFVKDWFTLQAYANDFHIDVVPCIFRGMVTDPEMLLKMLEHESFLGGQKIEGVVVKNYDRPFLLGGQPIPLMAGKYVSEKFKERHNKDWKKGNRKGKFELFKEGFRTEARWQKAVQHLRELDLLTNSPKDIGQLIKNVQFDIEAEEEDNIRNWLYKEFKGEILRYATRGIPEWYKDQLLKRSFDE